MKEQIIKIGKLEEDNFYKMLLCLNTNKVFVVCGKADYVKSLRLILNSWKYSAVYFDAFSPNPKLSEVKAAVKAFKNSGCKAIIAIGGGSTIDVAKCVKAFANNDIYNNLLENMNVDVDIRLLAIPTTAGTGSESTMFSVVYNEGRKYSVEDPEIIPEYVYLSPGLLLTLPKYQRVSTMLDALSHSIESVWSLRATESSKYKAQKALSMIMKSHEGYIKNNPSHNNEMLIAANLAGQAINISKTTAAHAMSYGLTSYYNISHGHAVALCLLGVWKYMLYNQDQLRLSQEQHKDIVSVWREIYNAMGFKSSIEAIEFLEKLVQKYDLKIKRCVTEGQIDKLCENVNVQRMNNFPIVLDRNSLKEIYRGIFNK